MLVAIEQKSALVSVIVPTYNRLDTLEEALQSILAQTYQDFNIVVINDGGVDAGGVVAELDSNKIVYVNHHENKGLAAARNIGIAATRSKYIAYLDDDDIFYPGHLETLTTFLENSAYSIAYTDAHRVQQVQREGGGHKIIRKDTPRSIRFSRDQLFICNIAPVLCFMHERECLEKAGLFDERLISHEDWDLWIRIALDYEFKHVTNVTAEFRYRKDDVSMTNSKLSGFLRTMEVIYKKYYKYTQHRPDIIERQDWSLQRLKSRAP